MITSNRDYLLDVDTVIPCIGQNVDLSALSGSSVDDDGWTIEVDPDTLATSQDGVFAGGDAVTGPTIAVDAMAAGRRAAESIRRYLAGEELNGSRPRQPEADPALDEIPRGMPEEPRMSPRELSARSRIESFDEVNCGYGEDNARREAERCLQCAICSECLECVEACEAEAIDHEQQPVVRDVEVGAVVLSPGFDEFEPDEIYEYGYGRIDNVVTSIEFERILSANGPTAGELVRPSDGEHPEKIAWIQCIGSRDEQVGCGYCSSVCCTYAIKEAEIAKEHSADPLKTTIFFMDMRTYGKDFERYYQRSIDDYDVDYVRSKVQQVSQRPDGSVVLRYASEDGQLRDEVFDMVVLSVGLRPPKDADNLAGITQIARDEYGFAAHRDFEPVTTTRDGVFSSGAFGGPKDIPETVMEASAAAGEVSAMLADARGTATRDKEYPPEIPVEGEPPRVGVFVCHCGINIGGVVDVPRVKEFAARLPYVTLAEENLYTCSQDTQELIKEKIQEHNLNRIVVASCTPRTHEPLFQETIREAGLNPYLFHMANIRDQCSWVHSGDPEAATEKACSLLRAAIAKATLLRPLPEVSVPVTESALVIGGGPSGMVSALNLARQGFEVHLVEKTHELGGNARHLASTLQGQDVPGYLQKLTDQVMKEPLISVYTGSEVSEAEGYVGNFRSTIKSTDGTAHEIEHGAVIIAVGGQQYEPKAGEFGFGQHPGVMSCREMEQVLESNSQQLDQADQLAIVHCVGSRDDDNPYCSRVCCSQAIKVALKAKRRHPDKEVHLLYRDIRAYGFSEKQYREARQLGINFVRYEQDCEPQVFTDGEQLKVRVTDTLLGRTVTLPVDAVGLSCGVQPADGVHHLSQLYKVPLNDDEFFLEAHVKLRPVDFATDGVFLAGLAHAPKLLSESIAQAQAAAGRASTLLSKDQLVVEGWAAEVDEQICSGCETCVEICPYSAIDMDEESGVAQVNEVLCKGCGACTVACRSGAIDTRGFTNQQVLEEVEAACLRVSD